MKTTTIYIPFLLCFFFFQIKAQNIKPAVLSNYGKQVQTSVDPAGKIHLVFGRDNSIYYSCSKNKGFTSPVKISELPAGLMLGRGRGPQIAAQNKEIVITAIDKTGSIFSWYSKDSKTWKGPILINDQKESAKEGFVSIAASPEGFYTIWSDSRSGNNQIFGAYSSDGGHTWSKNRLIYASPDTTICPCCKSNIIFDGTGKFYVMWRNQIEGQRNFYFLSFKKGFTEMSAPEKLGYHSWAVNYCPMDGGSISTNPQGKILTSWMQEKKVYLCEPGQRETLIDDGRTPVVGNNQKGTYIVYQSNAMIKAVTPSKEVNTLGKGQYPQLALLKKKGWIFWENDEGIVYKLLD